MIIGFADTIIIPAFGCTDGNPASSSIRAAGKLADTRLIPPVSVKPFVKRQKNDMADAEAICQAAQRPTMRFVQGKSAEAQASAVAFRTRDGGQAADDDPRWRSGDRDRAGGAGAC